MIGEKTCTVCGKELVLTMFSPDKRASDGKQSTCRPCGNARRRNPRARKQIRWTTETFAGAVNARTNGDYVLTSEYVGALTHVTILHIFCNKTYSVVPNNFLNGSRCPHCATESKRKTAGKFKEEVGALVGDDYSVVGDYVSARTYIRMRHNVCGSSYSVYPNNFLTGKRCPHCVESHGEAAVRMYLSKHRYTVTPQYKFHDCRNELPLPFDFAVHLTDRDILIEYDGEQHFRPIDFAGKGAKWARQQFRELQRRDRIKTAYCKARGIPLIRISYEDFDRIDAILDEALAQYGTETPEVSAA